MSGLLHRHRSLILALAATFFVGLLLRRHFAVTISKHPSSFLLPPLTPDSPRRHNKFFAQVFENAEGPIGDPFAVKLRRQKSAHRFAGDPQGIRDKMAEFNVSVEAPPLGIEQSFIPTCAALCHGYHANNKLTELRFAGTGACAQAWPYVYVPDSEIGEKGENRAAATIPCFLRVQPSKIAGAGRGVMTKVPLEAGLIFGPYEGEEEQDEETAMSGGYAWAVLDDYEDAKILHFIDAQDPSKSNWLRFVNSARFQEEQNVYGFSYQGHIWYLVYRPIPRDGELLTWYGPTYSENLGFPARSNITIVPGIAPYRKDVQCNVCDRGLFGDGLSASQASNASQPLS